MAAKFGEKKKNACGEEFETLTLSAIDNFCRDVADCPLQSVNYSDLDTGQIVMCHINGNWTEPEILGTVNWASEEPVDLGKNHTDMTEGQLFVKPGHLGSKNSKYNTVKKMTSNVCLHAYLFSIYLSPHHHQLPQRQVIAGGKIRRYFRCPWWDNGLAIG